MPTAVPATTTSLRVVGIDPGLTRCGLGVVDGPPARPLHRHHDTLRTDASQDLAIRLASIFEGIEGFLDTWQPDVVAVERVLFSTNVRTAMATGQSAGIALLAAARAGVPVRQITPTRVKATITGHGGADKEGVARLVTAHLRLDDVPTPADAADALAVALTGLLEHRGMVAAEAEPAGASTGAPVTAASWTDHLAARGLKVVGGTADPSRGATPGRSRR